MQNIMSFQTNSTRRSYLVRFWLESETLRATVENVQTGERRVFNDLTTLFEFIEQQAVELLNQKSGLPDRGCLKNSLTS